MLCSSEVARSHTIRIYNIDDTFIQSEEFNSPVDTIRACKEIFTKLGFLIQPDKSINIPSKFTKVLGFMIDSVSMTVSLAPDKKLKIQSYAKKQWTQIK